jgi:hypothetical protein
VFFEVIEFDKLKGHYRGGFKVDFGRAPVIKGLLPAGDTEAPRISGLQTGKSKFRSRGAEIVPAALAECQELCGHFGAHAVQPLISGSGPATTITEESRQRVERAGDEFAAEDIEIGHPAN